MDRAVETSQRRFQTFPCQEKLGLPANGLCSRVQLSPCLFRLRASRVAVIGSPIQRWKPLLSRRPGGCVSAAEYRPYLGAITGILLAECWIESFLIIISSPLNGGAGFSGKSGRKTANACETNAMETIVIAAAHFMVGALIKFQTPGKKNFRMIAIITDEECNDFILVQPISGFRF